MSLPILPSRPAATAADLIRYFYRCELQWSQQIGEEMQLDVGTAIVNSSVRDVWDANAVFEASLPQGATPDAAVAEADEHFRSAGSAVRKWVLNPSLPPDRTVPLGEHLVARGFSMRSYDIMHLSGSPAAPVQEVAGLRIIPARASFRHARLIAEESKGNLSPQVADAVMLHLEDPQTDAVLALKGDAAAGYVSVLTVGEMGSITMLHVTEKFRRQGIGRTLMSRALEICARSLFKHVFLSCEPTNAAAISLYRQLGFEKVGNFVCYVRP